MLYDEMMMTMTMTMTMMWYVAGVAGWASGSGCSVRVCYKC